MAQYLTGKINLTHNSANIVGVETEWLTNAEPGDLFIVQGEDAVYEVAAVITNTALSLTAPYAGTTQSNAAYVISRDFTTHFGIPYPQRGNIEVANILKRAITEIDSQLHEAKRVSMQGYKDILSTEALFAVYLATKTVKFPKNLPLSQAHYGATNVVSDVSIIIRKNGAPVGWIKFERDTEIGSFQFENDVVLVPGDRLELVTPVNLLDLGQVSWNIVGQFS